MTVDGSFWHSLGRFQTEISLVGGEHEYAIFGSSVLVIRDIIDRTPGDLDAFVSRRVWGALLARPEWRVETPNAGDPPILTLDTPVPCHLFFDWSDAAVDIDVRGVLHAADEYVGFRLASVEEVLRQKQAAYACLPYYPSVAKHAPDIEAIHTYLGREKVVYS